MTLLGHALARPHLWTSCPPPSGPPRARRAACRAPRLLLCLAPLAAAVVISSAVTCAAATVLGAPMSVATGATSPHQAPPLPSRRPG